MDIALKVRSAIRNGQIKEALQLLSAVIDEKTMHICRVCERRSTNAIVILIASSTTMTAMTRSSSNQWFNTLDGQRTAWYNTEECWNFRHKAAASTPSLTCIALSRTGTGFPAPQMPRRIWNEFGRSYYFQSPLNSVTKHFDCVIQQVSTHSEKKNAFPFL